MMAAPNLEVLLVHPGGPYWRKKDEGAWSIPKGETQEGEDAEAAARRQRFAITSREEAVAYLEHHILGSRLRECTAVVSAVSGRTIREILGSPDDLKFISSMTLFNAVSSDP